MEFHEENEAIERVIRIAQLRAEVEKMTGTPVVYEDLNDNAGATLKTQEAFWSHIHAFETAPYMTLEQALLEQHGLTVTPPDQLSTDRDLHAALWQLLNALGSMRVFFYSSDHLSDRAFYNLLVHKVLSEKTQIMPCNSGWNHRYDMADFPTEALPEANEIHFTYYADDAERDDWKYEFPDDPMPSKATLPYDRDRLLPCPPEERKTQSENEPVE
jgi:hypothetical protein